MAAKRKGRKRKRVSGNHVAGETRELGALIREERRKLKWAQEILAAEATLSQAAVSYLERGVNFPKVETIERIAAALGWRWEEFIGEARRRAQLRRGKI